MKYRLLEVLRCTSCGRSGLVLEKGAVIEQVPFRGSISHVRCVDTCGLKQHHVHAANIKSSDCTACYGQEIIEGTLRCQCGETWPVTGGIPRLLPKGISKDIKRTQDTFSYEWKMFRFGERNWGQDISFRRQLFLQGMGIDPKNMRGKLICDAGCGSGALSIEMANGIGMEVIAFDLALGIEQAYRHNDSPYVHFIQGSVLMPPVKEGAVDYLYCAGVLVVIPDPVAGFKAVTKTLKPGGRCFTWWYHPISPAYYPTDWKKMTVYTWVAHITSRLPIRMQYYLYLSWMPLFLAKQSLSRLLGRKPNIRTWREKMQALFDFFSPVYFHRNEPATILGLYRDNGFPEPEIAYREHEGFGVRADLLSSATVDASLIGAKTIPCK